MIRNNWIPHSERIFQLKMPLPFPLRWVNSYLIKGETGYTLIDPGLHTAESEKMWQEVMDKQRISFADIEQIVLTHHHPDHYGLSGWIQQQCSAPVYLSQIGHEQAVRLWGDQQSLKIELSMLYSRHGMDKSVVAQIESHMDSFIPLVSPQPKITFIEPEETILFGNRPYRIILTPGHAAGHLCFYDEVQQEIFCGDHVIPQISPNVSYVPGSDPNPLQSFLQSLEQISNYKVKKAYPGHRDPFTSFKERAAELIEHHQQRLDTMLGLMSIPLSAYQLCKMVFGEQLPIHQLRFAMSETLAHVIYLQQQGTIVAVEQDDMVRYLFGKPVG